MVVIRTLTASFVPATCHCRAAVSLQSSPRADRRAPIDGETHVVTVVDIGHRRDVYRT